MNRSKIVLVSIIALFIAAAAFSLNPPPEGACELPGLACDMMTEADCIAAGGTFVGDDAECVACEEEGIYGTR
jgi:hypothetical protein